MISSAIEFCLKDIYLQIPIEVLNEAFTKDLRFRNKSLDGIIKEVIIVDIVLRKVNLYAGKLKKIELKESYITYLDSPNIIGAGMKMPVYIIPAEARENKDIIAPIGIAYPINTYNNNLYDSYQYDSLQNKTNELFENTFSSGQPLPIPFLLDNNVIRLDPPSFIDNNIPWLLTCMLAYDSNFTNLSLNMFDSLSKLCIYATQQYIYNKLKIPINQAYLNSGVELGAFKETIESYSDAKEKFEEALLEFRGSAMFDKEQITSYFSLMNL